uniref:Uncharacterized protein n=1 Tax=Octopus bimaculoides TaxID=37653 RepID=A0A0L8I8W7_OCTBM
MTKVCSSPYNTCLITYEHLDTHYKTTTQQQKKNYISHLIQTNINYIYTKISATFIATLDPSNSSKCYVTKL